MSIVGGAGVTEGCSCSSSGGVGELARELSVDRALFSSTGSLNGNAAMILGGGSS